jgi:hypothetical protein
VSLLERLVEVYEQEWSPVGTPAFIASSLLVAGVCYLANTGERWVYVLDSANLVFHEAGHPFFGLLLGNRITVYGGTLGQLVFPIVATISFWWRREALSFALCTAWIFENFWNIARYMADARTQVLPPGGQRRTRLDGNFLALACVASGYRHRRIGFHPRLDRGVHRLGVASMALVAGPRHRLKT